MGFVDSEQIGRAGDDHAVKMRGDNRRRVDDCVARNNCVGAFVDTDPQRIEAECRILDHASFDHAFNVA